MNTRVYFALCVLSNDMSYYLYQIKRKLILLEYGDKPKLLRGLVEINCRKTGTGESLAGIAEYTCVIMLFTLYI